jgi:hypothetical protein
LKKGSNFKPDENATESKASPVLEPTPFKCIYKFYYKRNNKKKERKKERMKK